jgi:hypothetical protein
MGVDQFNLNDEVINSHWFKIIDELTIHDAAFCMVVGIDPEVHEQQCDSDSDYLQNYCEHPDAQDYVLEMCGRIQSAAHEGLVKLNRGADKNSKHLDINTTYISKISWLEWCQNKGYISTSPPIKHNATKQKVQNNKQYRNALDPSIDKAIELAGNMEPADVFLRLKELALECFPPFTGVIEGDSFCYTNHNDKPDKLSKDALGKRLSRRVE